MSMKIALIPHPAQQKILRELQTSVLKAINTNGNVLAVPFFPMWLEIAECPKNECPENFLNQMKSQIKSVLLEDICSENKMIFIKCQIQLADASSECRKLERKLKIAEYLASEHSDNENLQTEKIIRQIPDGSAFNMPANLRIFELGTAEFQGFCWHVEKSVWVKLKN